VQLVTTTIACKLIPYGKKHISHMISIEKKIATSFTMICEPDLDLIGESKECFANVEEGGEGHARHDPNVSCTPFIDK